VRARSVRIIASGAQIVWCLLFMARLVTSEPAPAVNVRWRPEVTDLARLELERQLELKEARNQEGRTWSYDLIDSSPASVRRLVQNPMVEDTHNIDRRRAIVADGAPAGLTTTWWALGIWPCSRVPAVIRQLEFATLAAAVIMLIVHHSWSKRDRPVVEGDVQRTA
jgi:hypothetical protein